MGNVPTTISFFLFAALLLVKTLADHVDGGHLPRWGVLLTDALMTALLIATIWYFVKGLREEWDRDKGAGKL
ncbi:MAG TPA: hypothetical protein VNJ51_01120 [Candidatus Dormibacteraeota bacterium]|nr:hypothetical protein [Candidatus Dormibacteraeota bacterium]